MTAAGPDQARPVRIQTNYLPTAEGSALIETGNTKVICTASVEDSVPGFPARIGPRLGHRGIRDAASSDEYAHEP